MTDNSNAVPAWIAQSSTITAAQWNKATEPQRKVLENIEKQRTRIKARALAREQAQTVRKQEVANLTGVRADAPLVERLMTFVRLHPVAVAVAGAATLALGPRRLIRVGGILLPLILRMRQNRG